MKSNEKSYLALWLGFLAAWILALTLAMHNRLTLIMNPKTGDKYCIDELANFLGIEQGLELTAYIGIGSMILSLALPVIAAVIVLVKLRHKNCK